MYLKKIEAYGFKSFANKTVLEFKPGIMGIVGPNGSGKSNVGDAIRWVLGEQSAKSLRGSNMQDIIFAGTENRKPQGFASVALTIDNRDHVLAVDYDEVTVARRVYRSGESEYLLNGSACRLRDVQELFYDTGVGKEGYSIIGQGQVERILNGKPEERRELFDETAGIVKYRKRKNITEKKLETEEGNLVRVTDILKELEKQVGPLERQSEKARVYLKLKDELKKADMTAFRLESSEYKRKLGEAEKNLEIVTGDRENTSGEAAAIIRRYDEITEKLSALESERDRLRDELSGRRVRKESLEGEVRILSEQVSAARMNEENARERLAKINQNIEQHQEELGRLRDEKQGLSVEEGSLSADIESSEIDMESARQETLRLKTQQEELGRRRTEAMNAKAEQAAALERCEILLEQAADRSEKLAQEADAGKDEKDTVDGRIRETKEYLSKLDEETAKEKKRQSEASRKKTDSEKQRRNLNETLSQKQQKLIQARSRRDSLTNLAERYEGYGNAVRRIMEMKGSKAGILGVVADLFHTEQKYETAIETALGGRIQNVVTDSEKSAKELIGWLKQNRAGRATFLPLESIRGRDGAVRAEVRSEAGFLGRASELIETEDRYRAVAEHLLGRFIVVDTVDHALAMARKYHYSLNLVTLDGESLSPGGAITGGAFKNNSNLLGRRREIEDLSEQISKLSTEISAARKRAEELETAVEEADAVLADADRELHKIELVRNTASMELRTLNQHAEEWKNLRDARQEEEKLLKTRLRDLGREKAEADQKMAALDLAMKTCEESAAASGKHQAEQEEQMASAASRLAELRQKAAALRQRIDFLTENQERLIREKEDLEQEKQDIEEGAAGGGKLASERTERIEELKTKIRQEMDLCEKEEKNLEESSKERDLLASEQKKLFSDRETLTERMSALDKEYYRLKNSEERLTDQLGKLTEYIWSEYEMTPSEAEAAGVIEGISLADSRRTVSRTKQEIRELGPVNVNAIEEYKDVSERYTFLKEQHDDLTAAAESLKGIIRDLESGMRQQFTENFAKIKKEFGETFKELFGGGKGTLELTEAEDVLEAGIIINAQPPGKKLQNMMQLSGGEKALSAIALLFAIQNLKPSPFCLLDEIEAALDEPNVDRFAAYLDKLKGRTQFIVITHRRGTMEMAERLYGITMQEKGVSALVSVDLTDPAIAE